MRYYGESLPNRVFSIKETSSNGCDEANGGGKIYGYHKLHDDLCDQGETCCPNRVARSCAISRDKAQINYQHRPVKYGDKPSEIVGNALNQRFDVDVPDQFWVTNITYIKN